MQLLQRFALAQKFDAHEARADYPGDPLRASAVDDAECYIVGPTDVEPEELLGRDDEPWFTASPDSFVNISGGAWA